MLQRRRRPVGRRDWHEPSAPRPATATPRRTRSSRRACRRGPRRLAPLLTARVAARRCSSTSVSFSPTRVSSGAVSQVAAGVPGVELQSHAEDSAGRTGTAVSIEYDQGGVRQRQSLVFDPNTSKLLERRQVYVEAGGLHIVRPLHCRRRDVRSGLGPVGALGRSPLATRHVSHLQRRTRGGPSQRSLRPAIEHGESVNAKRRRHRAGFPDMNGLGRRS
jgi:hypothetical protein